MTLYDRIKDLVSAETAAIRYAGLRPIRRGLRTWACCPFHREKTPSLMFDKKGRFHCFGCGAGGSSIDFLASYYGITTLDAAKRLAQDFGLTEEPWHILPELAAKRQSAFKMSGFDRCLRYSREALTAAVRYWRAVKFGFSPSAMYGEFTDLFAEACRKLPELEATLDELEEGSIQRQAQIMLEHRDDIERMHLQYMPDNIAWDLNAQLNEDVEAACE